MTIIGVPRRSWSGRIDNSCRRRNANKEKKYGEISSRVQYDEIDELEDDKKVKPKRKGAKVWFDTYRRGVYY
jgi:hypothetical protein